jgi:hypothetical protein
MRRLIVVAAAALTTACAGTGMREAPRPMGVAPAPITYDGHVAAQATDLVFVLVPGGDPAVPGLSLAAGDTLAVQLPKDFERNVSAPLSEDTDRNLVLTRGRPILSGAVLRDAKYPGGGKPNPGLLPIQFRAGDKPGRYRPIVELIGGNSYQFTLIAE